MLMRRNHSTLQFNTRNIQSLAITTHHYRYILLHTCSRVNATCIHSKREPEHEVCLQRQVIPKSQPNPTFYPHQPMKQWSLFKETSYPILNLIIFSNFALSTFFFPLLLTPVIIRQLLPSTIFEEEVHCSLRAQCMMVYKYMVCKISHSCSFVVAYTRVPL